VQLPHSPCRCYKIQPLLLRGFFVAMGYIATKIMVVNSHFYNAFRFVPPDNIAAPQLIRNSIDINKAFE
jgi:hypothetical protein